MSQSLRHARIFPGFHGPFQWPKLLGLWASLGQALERLSHSLLTGTPTDHAEKGLWAVVGLWDLNDFQKWDVSGFFLRRPGNQSNKCWSIIVGGCSGVYPILAHTQMEMCLILFDNLGKKPPYGFDKKKLVIYPEDMFLNQLNHTHTIYMNEELEVWKTLRHTCWSCSVANNPIPGSTFWPHIYIYIYT